MAQLTDEGIRIAKRVVTYMIERSEQAITNSTGSRPYTCPACGEWTALIDVDLNRERDLAFFMGLGLSLAVIYEEMTARTAGDKKPQELIEWALNLPHAPYRKVERK